MRGAVRACVCTATACVLPCCCSQVAHVGDALADTAAIDGGAAGIIVDLFADGQLIPQLTQVGAWVGEWLAGVQEAQEERWPCICLCGCPAFATLGLCGRCM